MQKTQIVKILDQMKTINPKLSRCWTVKLDFLNQGTRHNLKENSTRNSADSSQLLHCRKMINLAGERRHVWFDSMSQANKGCITI